ncbi:MAG: hypothetical protein RL154_1558, partial [Pseudomonadota bacterium]
MREKAKKVLEKSCHYKFFKENINNFEAINAYKGFENLDKYYDLEIYDSSHKPHFNLAYICWFATICVLEDFGDNFWEFQNDL